MCFVLYRSCCCTVPDRAQTAGGGRGGGQVNTGAALLDPAQCIHQEDGRAAGRWIPGSLEDQEDVQVSCSAQCHPIGGCWSTDIHTLCRWAGTLSKACIRRKSKEPAETCPRNQHFAKTSPAQLLAVSTGIAHLRC